jgi:pre-rRNA-processing protein TSR1
VHSLDSTKDVSTTLWNVVNAKHRTLPWRDGHPYLLAQDISFVPSVDNPDMGTLLVTGYTRGQSFNVNDLVHLPALGACKVSGVTAEQDPAIAPHADGRRPGKGTVIAAPHPERQQDLDSVVPLDPLAGEQTWPTDEEIAAAHAENEDGAGPVAEVPTAAAGQRLVRVPKGTSSYQAQWIVDAVDFDAGDAGGTAAEDDGDAMAMADATMDADSDDGGAAAATSGAHVTFAEDPDEEFEVIDATDTAAERAREYDAEMDADEEQGALDAAAEDKEFPDEVDTPQHMLAKVRFQKYRGLQSFRHSRWDPREELPEDYARIFQFQSFSRTRKRVLAKNSGDGTPGWVAPGRYVTLHVESISAEYFAAIPDGQVFIGFGLLEHENRKSVLNFKLQMHSTYSTPIRSKEKLIFYTGIRRFTSCPIFSQHSVGDKHKFERFFQAGEVCVASTFAPIHYPPSPVLVFRNTEEGVRLVATGSLLSVNPDRMVIKRIRLSAHPFKINKRTATLRFVTGMLFWHSLQFCSPLCDPVSLLRRS